jgi:hypothetical protein
MYTGVELQMVTRWLRRGITARGRQDEARRGEEMSVWQRDERARAQKSADALVGQLANLSMLSRTDLLAMLADVDAEAGALPTGTHAFGSGGSPTSPVELARKFDSRSRFLDGRFVVLSGVMGEPTNEERAAARDAKQRGDEADAKLKRAMFGREAMVEMVETMGGKLVESVPTTILYPSTLPCVFVIGPQNGYRKLDDFVASLENRVLCAEELLMREFYWLPHYLTSDSWRVWYDPRVRGSVISDFDINDAAQREAVYRGRTSWPDGPPRPVARFGRLLTSPRAVHDMLVELVSTHATLDVAFVSVRWLSSWMQDPTNWRQGREKFMKDALARTASGGEAGGMLEVAGGLRSHTQVENSVLKKQAGSKRTADQMGADDDAADDDVAFHAEVLLARTDTVRRIRECATRTERLREVCDKPPLARFELATQLVNEFEVTRKDDRRQIEARLREDRERLRQEREEARGQGQLGA